LALLGANDKSSSEAMYDCLQEVLKAADTATNVGCAITYECIRTITSVYPHVPLLDAASASISRFISAENHNLKYLGLNSLVSIVQINPKYAAEHQLTVIDCLEDPDDTLKRKTLDLLYSMTNPHNVIVIVEKLTGFLRANTDAFLRAELVGRISQLAEKYAPSHAWYLQIMNSLFELGGDLVRIDMAHSLMRLLAEAPAGGDLVSTSSNPADIKDNVDIRAYAVDIYIAILRKPNIPDLLLQVIAWVLGEFGHLSQSADRAQITSLLVGIEKRAANDVTLRAYVLSALQKNVAGADSVPQEVKDLVDRYRNSMSADLQQRAYEFWELLKAPTTLRNAQPKDGYAEDVKVDVELSFIDGSHYPLLRRLVLAHSSIY
jgi:AP-4 complex subunit epsilon-1